ncbi:hypothetical protein GWI33_018960 [Rhynchophorus ferrugineus]|uniref:DUF7041 domain-containing protein n=1 Tax=Rhynchophorus ferrugineus TaxID=354439 RepID=A0A834HUV3_RHYFE|nr:hypothetical protein GWI33_018960 [Rhynchophorus ferrugineus]
MSAPKIRLPAFNPNDPEMWFLQVEWTLKQAVITTSAEKFEIVGAALDPIYTQEVRGLLFNPPPEAEDPFSKLKEALRECLGLSIQNRTRQLLEREEIGDRTPSQFLRRLQSLAGDTASQDIIKVIWMSQLDPITRASIAAQQGSTKLEDLAKIADNIKDSIGPWRPAGGTAPSNNSESQLAEFARLRLQIHGLQVKVDKISEHHHVIVALLMSWPIVIALFKSQPVSYSRLRALRWFVLVSVQLRRKGTEVQTGVSLR